MTNERPEPAARPGVHGCPEERPGRAAARMSARGSVGAPSIHLLGRAGAGARRAGV